MSNFPPPHQSSSGGANIIIAWPLYDGSIILLTFFLLAMRWKNQEIRERWALPHVSVSQSGDEPEGTSLEDLRNMRLVTLGVHAVMTSVVTFLVAFRVMYFYLIVCPDPATASHWTTCSSLGSTLAAATTTSCIIATVVYAAFCVEFVWLSVVTVTGAFASVVGGSFAGQPLATTTHITPETVIIVTVVFVLGWVTTMLLAAYVNNRQRGQFVLVAMVEARTEERIDSATAAAAAIAELAQAREATIRADSERKAAEAASAFVAHSLRNPLHQVTNLIENLLATQDSPTVQEQMRSAATALRGRALPSFAIEDLLTMSSAARCMEVVVGDMLAYQRILSGEVEVVPGSINIRRLLGELSRYYSNDAVFPTMLRVADDVPLALWWDGGRVTQIMHHVLSQVRGE